MDIEYGKNNKKKILKFVLACIGIIALFVYTKPVKIIKMVLEGNYQQSINNNEEKIDIGDKRNYNETIENYDEKFKKGLVNAYGQELTVGGVFREITDWTNKIEGLDKDHELHPLDDGDQGVHPYYYANLGDCKNWEIGPNGYPEPPEEFKMRAPLSDYKDVLNGTNETKKKMVQRQIDLSTQCYGVYYKIEGKTYCIMCIPMGRTVFLDGKDYHGKDDRVLMNVGKNDKSTDDELLALCIADQKGLLTKAAKK